MTPNHAPSLPALGSSVRIPQHVVYRSFASETVVLNLVTGKYHGINPTGGRMLEHLERSASIGEAAVRVAAEFEQPVGEIEDDLTTFCADLAERGLIDIVTPPAG